MGLFDQCFAHLGTPREPTAFKVERHKFPGGHGDSVWLAPELLGIQPVFRAGPGRFDLIERAQQLAKEQGFTDPDDRPSDDDVAR